MLQPLITGAGVLAEGPIWDDCLGRLLWVDIVGQRVHGYVLETELRLGWDVGTDVGAVALAEAGGLLLATKDGFAALDEASGTCSTIAEPLLGRPDLRMNDGACDPRGRFLAGSMAYDARPGAGSLYSLDPDGSVRIVLSPVSISNGIAWSADGEFCFFVDTATGGIDRFRYDLDTGTLADRARIVDISPPDGAPDGLTLDSDGGLWVALWGGGAVRRYTAEGALTAELTVAASLVTSCAFGGADLDQLFVTTATVGLSEEEMLAQPLAGAVLVAEPGVTGLPPWRFGGNQS